MRILFSISIDQKIKYRQNYQFNFQFYKINTFVKKNARDSHLYHKSKKNHKQLKTTRIQSGITMCADYVATDTVVERDILRSRSAALIKHCAREWDLFLAQRT